MKLVDASIENMIDSEGNELTLVRKFGEVIKSARLAADVYINDHKVFSAPVCVTENTGWLIASIDCRFAFSSSVAADRILIKVRHVGREEVLFSSNTVNICIPLDVADYDADLNFKLMSVWQGNSGKTQAAESRLVKLVSTKFKEFELDDQPGPNSNVVPDDGTDQDDPVDQTDPKDPVDPSNNSDNQDDEPIDDPTDPNNEPTDNLDPEEP